MKRETSRLHAIRNDHKAMPLRREVALVACNELESMLLGKRCAWQGALRLLRWPVNWRRITD